MELLDIARALAPFIPEGTLSDAQLSQVSAYLDLLLKWNAKINLTAVRSPAEILSRHFGESFFSAHHLSRLFPDPVIPSAARNLLSGEMKAGVVDLGSGAGFPGLPLKIYAPNLSVTLIESNQKKATFLREVIRALKLAGVNVFSSRAEEYVKNLSSRPSVASGGTMPLPLNSHITNPKSKITDESPNHQITNSPKVVTLRAVEHFDRILPLAAQIANSQSPNDQIAQSPNWLALLIGFSQLPTVHRLLPHFWDRPIPIPLSHSRILLFGSPSSDLSS